MTKAMYLESEHAELKSDFESITSLSASVFFSMQCTVYLGTHQGPY